MKVAFVVSEVAPLSKTGGLADVGGSLPRALARLGVEVTVFTPLYGQVRRSGARLRPLRPSEAKTKAGGITVPHGPGSVKVGLEGTELPGGEVKVVCIAYDPYFDRAGLYGEAGGDYPDGAHRFALFAKAVILAAHALGLSPDIYHVHDWQGSLLPVYVKMGLLKPERAATVLTVHNLGYQGVFWKWDLPWTGLPWEVFEWRGVEFHGKLNLLKGGIVYADAVTTVSPNYAGEICSGPEYGQGLEGVLRDRRDDLVGIVNGIDTRAWDPENDPLIPARYSAGDLAGKGICKRELQKETGLDESPSALLIGFVGRLAEQKGVSLLVECLGSLLGDASRPQMVVLGSGEPALEGALLEAAERHPGRLAVRVGFDEPLAHRIYAGADMFVMPSRYEPCGLGQLYSMRYGTVPVARRTGGLADTVEDSPDESPDRGTGFLFEEFAPGALLGALARARRRYESPDAWRGLVRRAMSKDWSWTRSAKSYLQLYERLLKKPRAAAGHGG